MFHADSTRHSEDMDFRKRSDNRYHDCLLPKGRGGGGAVVGVAGLFVLSRYSFPMLSALVWNREGLDRGGNIMALMTWFFNK